jgi:hypothetical protein
MRAAARLGACAERQDWAATRGRADAHPSLNELLDAILAARSN